MQLAAVDARQEGGVVGEEAVDAEDVRHEVVGEDRQPVEVGEGARALAVEGEGEVGGEELRAFVEGHVAAVIGRDVSEERHL